ncbi:bcl-2-like protein 11 isoform X5 [Scyliorhinus torazame]|uniref:bcl-2-like protein 11 isoform X5 n=1 Tax=Scyliorhinus torazame TaxID=75743 RepID=UPI003B5BE31D
MNGEKCNDFVFHRSEGGTDGTKQHPYSRLNITSMSRERIQPSTGIQESSPSVPMDVRPEVWIGQELRRIGDDFNSHFQTGRLGGGGDHLEGQIFPLLQSVADARNHRPPNNQNGIFWHWINVLYRRRINGV